MTWWKRRRTVDKNLQDAEQALTEAQNATRRVSTLAADVQPGLDKLAAHRQDNHILDAMMSTLGRGLV